MRAILGLVLLFSFIAGCTGPASPGQNSEGKPAARKAITISLEGEFNALATELDSAGVSGLSSYAQDFIHNYITVHGDNDEVLPQLAAQLPSLDDGTWNVLPDGSMEITWKLRQGVLWHDGTEFTSADVKFGWEATVDPAAPLGVPGEAASRIYAMETPDPYTVVTHWKVTSRWGREFGRMMTNLLPQHLLEADFLANKAGFGQHPYFTSTDVVIGTGPFKAVEWERGSHLTVQAFDQYWAGRPKLDQVTFKFIKDNNTVLANLLAGELDVANRGLNWDAVQLLQRDWVTQGKGELQVTPTNFRHNLYQMRPELASPADLTNPNVRRALIYAVDHDQLVEGVFPGAGGHTVADSIGYPGTPIGDALEASIVKYPYDARKASQLLEDAGWTRGQDGILVKNGERFRLDMQAGGDTEDDKTFLLMEPNYKAIGVELVYSSFGGRRQTPEDTAKFPGLQKTGLPYNQPTFGRRWDSRQIAAPENRYTGGNREGYVSPAVDQALDNIDRSIRFDEELRWWADAWHHITDDAAVMGLFFVPNPIAERTGMHGAFANNPSGTATWRAYTWDTD